MQEKQESSNNPAEVSIFQENGNELKRVNLTIAREFGNDKSNLTVDEFYHNSGLKLLQDTIFKNIAKSNINSCFFEYSTLCSTIDGKGLSAFLCLFKIGELLSEQHLAGNLNKIIRKLFQKKLSLYYLRKFFIQPESDVAFITILPEFKETDYYKNSIKDEFEKQLIEYAKTELPTTFIERTNSLIPIDSDSLTFVQNLTFSEITYEQVIENSKHFSQDNPLPNHLLLHHLYDEELYKNRSCNLKTILISVPMLGAPIFDNKDCFNGQGAFFLYLITEKDIQREQLENLVRDISNLNRDITYNYLFEVGYRKAKEAKKAAIKSAIVQYMARNLSHNTGSHLIPEAIIYFRENLNEEKGGKFAYYQKYTQERMELLAQLSSMKNNHNWTNYNLNDIVKEFDGSIIPKGLCDDLNNNQKEIVVKLKSGLENKYVSLPDGAVGKQAFYVILENFIRNAYKHAEANSSYLFEINVSQPFDEEHNSDYWCIDLYDKLGCLNEEKRTQQKLDDINNLIKSSVLTEDAQLRERGWGLLEMKSAAAFLRGFSLEDLDDFQLDKFKAEYYETEEPASKKHLGHRFYLKKPSLLIIDEDMATQEQKNSIDELRTKGIVISTVTDAKTKVEPHQFIITNKEWEFTNHKVITKNIETNKSITEIENDLWLGYIQKNKWESTQIISSQDEQKSTKENAGALFDKHGETLSFFDSHGKELMFNGSNLKAAKSEGIRLLKLPFYHPYKSGSGIGSMLLKSKEESRYKGIIIEAIKTNVLIIDERIQNASKSKDNDQTNLSLQEIFSFMGIAVPARKELNLSDFLENPTDEKRTKIIGLIQDKNFHYVILHLTILEKLACTNDKKMLGNYIATNNGLNEQNNFVSNNRALVLVSGRGEPPNLPENSYYLNYTTLYDCLIYLMSKPHLVQILSTIRKR